MTEPIAEVSATAEPEIPLKKVVASTLTADSPPRRRMNPTRTLAKATSRRAIPPSAMIAPASTKNGIVSIATLLTPLEICCMTASTGIPIQSAPAMAASPREYAIGTPSAMQTKRQMMTSRMSTHVLPQSIEGDRLASRGYAGHRTLDDEQQQDYRADRDRQVS